MEAGELIGIFALVLTAGFLVWGLWRAFSDDSPPPPTFQELERGIEPQRRALEEAARARMHADWCRKFPWIPEHRSPWYKKPEPADGSGPEAA